MTQRRALPRVAVSLGLTATLLCARLAAVPALGDPVGGPAFSPLHLQPPWFYLALAPLFTLWDGVSMLSISRLRGLLIGLAALYLGWRIVRLVRHRRLRIVRELLTLAVSVALLLVFLITGALWHRPMLSLAGTDPRDIVVDFHSHTDVSHDVRNTWMRGFDLEANRRWHARAGFDAVFITDHNTVEGLARNTEGPGTGDRDDDPVVCPGIEVSAWRAHIVLLGDSLPVDRTRYDKSLAALLTLLRTSDTAYGALSVASLPEYRINHWANLGRLAGAGLDGFEIVNASPRANELTKPEVDSVVAIARAYNRFIVGVSDSHGWGATSMVWNLVRASKVPGKTDRCAAVLDRLHAGFPAVRVIERYRLRPDSWWPMWLTPAGVIWETWRSMGWKLTIAWMVWIWVLSLLAVRSWGTQDKLFDPLRSGNPR